MDTAEHALLHVDRVQEVSAMRLRWVGHRLQGDATIAVPEMPLSEGDAVAADARAQVLAHLRNMDEMHVRVTNHAKCLIERLTQRLTQWLTQWLTQGLT